MNDKPQSKTLSKQKLEIVNIEMDVPYSQGTKQLDRVQAINLSLADGDPLAGKTLRITIFKGDLKTFIRGKTHIVADIEERPRPESDYGPDRTIVQVYDDKGEPVSRKTGGGGGGYRRTLEEDLALEAVKRRSIEGQTAVAQVGAILTGREIEGEALGIGEDDWKRILGKYWKAVERGLDNFLSAPTPAPGNPPASRQRAQDGKRTADKPAQGEKPAEQTADPVKHDGDLLTRANKIGVTPADVAIVCEVNRPDEIKDLEAAWKKVQEYARTRKTSEEKGDDQKTAAATSGQPEKLFD